MRDAGRSSNCGCHGSRGSAELCSSKLHRGDRAAAEAFRTYVKVGNQSKYVSEVLDGHGGGFAADRGLGETERARLPGVQATVDESLVVINLLLHQRLLLLQPLKIVHRL